MPYIACSGCGLRVYTAAAYSGLDSCPRCGVALLHRRAAHRDEVSLRYAAEAFQRLTRRSSPGRRAG
jgi:hypothetical protein